MPAWFRPAAIVCFLMFVISPVVIANAPYEATMGLVQKIFYYHVPSAMTFFVAAIVCGVHSWRYLFRKSIAADRLAAAAAELAVVLGAITLVTGPLWARKSWGVWWQWDVRLFGMANVPFVYISVNVWRTIHPTTNVVPTLPVSMGGPFWFCMAAFILLFVVLLKLRVRLEQQRAQVDALYLALED
jgi:ABC-type transport system involved in cytochrome c biogenesis permease subunit